MDLRILGQLDLIIMAILTILLIISELLGWSNCKPSSLSQYIYSKIQCNPPEDENNTATQTPQTPKTPQAPQSV